MPVSSREPEFRIDNPSALIRARIREKRIFEARFLCRQLGGELGPMEKSALEGELSKLLSQVDKLRKQALVHAAAGRLQLAAKVYREIERIAIDVPDVAAERQRIDGAGSLLVQAAATGAQATAASSTEPEAVAPLSAEQVSPPVRPSRRMVRSLPSFPRRWLVLAVSLLVFGGLLSFFLLRDRTPDHQGSAIIPAAPGRIVIRPMVSAQPAPTAEKEDKGPGGQAARDADQEKGAALSIGALQVRPGHPE